MSGYLKNEIEKNALRTIVTGFAFLTSEHFVQMNNIITIITVIVFVWFLCLFTVLCCLYIVENYFEKRAH